jgi:hypothetical protein
VRIGGFVAPLKQSRHNSGVGSGPAKCLHGAFIFPSREGPESPSGVDQQAPAAESGGAHNLTLRSKGVPKKCWHVPPATNSQPCYRYDHSLGLENSHDAGDSENLRGVHCTFCSRAISFCGKVSSDSDHSLREVARVFISIFFENSSRRRTFSRIFACVSSVSSTVS